MFRALSFSSRLALLKAPSVSYSVQFSATATTRLDSRDEQEETASHTRTAVERRTNKLGKTNTGAVQDASGTQKQTDVTVRKGRGGARPGAGRPKQVEATKPGNTSQQNSSRPGQRSKEPLTSDRTGAETELPTAEQCRALSDYKCHLILDHQDPKGVRKFKQWNLSHQAELVRCYMGMQAFSKISDNMRPRLNLNEHTYRNRFESWSFPVVRSEREHLVKELWEWIRDQKDDTTWSLPEIALEVETTKKGRKRSKKSAGTLGSLAEDSSSIILNDMTKSGDVKRHPQDYIKQNVIGNANEKELSRPTSFESEHSPKSYPEWKDKTGLLYTPKNTGFPEADWVSDQIFRGYGGDTKQKRKRVLCDPWRIHVVQKELCDDILERLGPSLEKHIGCDIIEVHPGPGIWSSAVHNLLKPRTHILMEPDVELYEPLLKPLLDAPDSTYRLVAKSGLVWSHLENILTPENFPHQNALQSDDSRRLESNNTLLFIANLGSYPRKPYRGFPSISTLVIYQLLAAARANSLFHQYGLVRMLIWVADDEKQRYVPKNILHRRKGVIAAEISCSEISEVASSTHVQHLGMREHSLDVESCRETLNKMEEAGIYIPEHRAKPIQLEVAGAKVQEARSTVRWSYLPELEELEKRFAAGEFTKFKDTPEAKKAVKNVKGTLHIRDFWTPEYHRYDYLCTLERFAKRNGKQFGARTGIDKELSLLRERLARGEISKFIMPESEVPSTMAAGGSNHWTAEYLRMCNLRRRISHKRNRNNKYEPLFEEYDHSHEIQKTIANSDASDAATLRNEVQQRMEILKEKIQSMPDHESDEFLALLDNRIAFYQDPPILYWDRRKLEPLNVKSTEFFPRHEMALLDFQPKAIWPILRENFPANYDLFDLIVGYIMAIPTQTVRQGLQGLYPGALEWLVGECPTLTNPNKGGNMDLDLLTVRCLTQEMYKEIVEAWIRWPFRPTTFELMRRMGSHVHDHDDEWRATMQQPEE